MMKSPTVVFFSGLSKSVAVVIKIERLQCDGKQNTETQSRSRYKTHMFFLFKGYFGTLLEHPKVHLVDIDI